jgi:acyl carrier protein
MDSLPRTPSGKIDRRALPTPDQSRPDLKSVFITPRTPTEEFVARTWADVLKLERVGIHDNFFELGGHSLLATRVVSRLRESLNIEMPLRVLFEHPTVMTVAEYIDTSLWLKKGHSFDSSERDNIEL